jgi:hypothetical protein
MKTANIIDLGQTTLKLRYNFYFNKLHGCMIASYLRFGPRCVRSVRHSRILLLRLQGLYPGVGRWVEFHQKKRQGQVYLPSELTFGILLG